MRILLPTAGTHVEWNEPTRARVREFQARGVETADEVVRLAIRMLNDEAPVNLGLLLQAYIYGEGSVADSTRYRLRQLTDEIGTKQGVLASGASFFEHMWSVKPSAVETHCPELLPLMLPGRSNEGLEVTNVLEPCPNEAIELRLPMPLGGLIRRPWRAPFRIFSTNDAVVYVDPFQFQLLTRDRSSFWISGSPRALSRYSLPVLPALQIDKNIVVVQDRFDFSNLCHFLFDGVTRILHYIEQFGTLEQSLFVLGSVPSDYHELVCRVLSEGYGIPRENLFFPTGAYILSTSRMCYWFSDQVEGHMHPAQMAHPRSISFLADLCAKLPASGGAGPRVYISRADASRRRVANEAALTAALEGAGFAIIRLAELPATEQIGVFREAEVVVGPHGMGLSHIVTSQKLGRLIELFHPSAGTDAYAFVAKAGGVDYDFVIGSAVPDSPTDFNIDVDRVLDLVGPEDAPVHAPAWRRSENLIPASRSFRGFIGVGGSTADPAVDQMIWGEETRLHTKRSLSSEVGRWPCILIRPRERYTASCWVKIPEDFSGSSVALEFGGVGNQASNPADLTRRGVWQMIRTVARADQDGQCSIGLLVEGPEESRVLSTCWKLEAGCEATAYSATG